MVRRQKVSKGKTRDEGREREAMGIRAHFKWECHSHCCIAADSLATYGAIEMCSD